MAEQNTRWLKLRAHGNLKANQQSRRIRTVLVLLVGTFVIYWMLRWFEHNQVFHPSRSMDATGAELGRPYEDVFFAAADGTRLNGWFYPGQTNSPRAHYVILVCHGNAGNISHRLDTCGALLETGVAVFLLDYRGYGRSGGRASEKGTCLDAEAAYRWLTQKGFERQRIIVYGESLGGGVASHLTLTEKTGGLILQSTFTSIPDIGAELFPFLPVRLLARIRYETCSRLPKIQVPVLVMHSRNDGLIDFRHAERNFAAACEPKVFCELQGVHNDPLADRQAFIGGIEKLLRLVETAQAQPALSK